MINVLFWNINRKSYFESIVSDVVLERKIDILLLAEAENINDNILSKLSNLKRIESPLISDHKNLTPKFFSSNNGFSLDHYHISDSKRLVFCFLELPHQEDILIGGIHFPSKIHCKGRTPEDLARTYINRITDIEDNRKRTILLGDFNMNPFEQGMISPTMFNATLSKQIALQGKRTFHHSQYDYFYNPMWAFMGDINSANGHSKIPGSYFFSTTSDSEIIYWNVFDKVLIRPQIIDQIDYSSIEYIDKTTKHNFLNQVGNDWEIDNKNYSDHLPLFFKIKK